MTKPKGLFVQTYTLQAPPRTNSITGKLVTEELGPFCVCVPGCAHEPLTEAEIVASAEQRHGLPVIRVTTKKFTGGKWVEVPHPIS